MSLTHKEAYDRLCRILAPASPYAGEDLAPDHPCWPLVFQIADANLVLPELYQCILHKRMQAVVPEPMLARLDEVGRLVEIRNSQLLAQMQEVNAAFAEAEVLPVWLKGAALLSESIGHRQLRLMVDLDVWVPEPDKQARALTILANLGYAPGAETLGADSTESHHYPPLFHPERPLSLELHRHIVCKIYSSMLPDAEAKKRLELSLLDGLPIARLALPDRIMHSLIQCSLMSIPRIETGHIRLMKMLDLAKLLARDGTHTFPLAVVSKLRSSPWQKPLRRFLTLFERDFLVANPLGTDSAYCDAVDHILLHGHVSPRVALRELLRPPTNWWTFISQPREWGNKIKRRLEGR